MTESVEHGWVHARLAAWRAGLLADEDAARVAAHVAACASCREVGEAYTAPAAPRAGEHLSAALLADWPRARRELRGLERALARRHLERCAECRQDLELLGQTPVLETVPALEPSAATLAVLGAGGAPAANATVPATGGVRAAPAAEVETMRVIRIVRPRPRWWERALVGWASVATAAAAVAIVMHARRPVVEPPPPALDSGAVASTPRIGRDRPGGISLAFAPRPRSLNAPAKGPDGEGGKVNVIPVVGSVRSLALAVKPLSIPDTSLVNISLLNAVGDTLFTVRHRQWEFFPKRVLMIDGAEEPLEPGQYALVLASLIREGGAPTPLVSRYRFELRPR